MIYLSETILEFKFPQNLESDFRNFFSLRGSILEVKNIQNISIHLWLWRKLV